MQDPALFSAAVLAFVPYEYQMKFLRETSKRIVVCAGRQVGKSTMAAARSIWFAITQPRTTTLIVSSTLRQSMLMFEKIAEFVRSSPLVKKSVKYETRRQIIFSNKSKIIALPCGPVGNSIRGYTAHLVILDEAAFVPDEVISNIIFPTLSTTDGTVMMLSTPWDRDHSFYKAFTSSSWSKYHFPSSANPEVKQEFLDEQRNLYGEQRFAQEYLAEFTDDEKSYFPMSLLRPCVHLCGNRSTGSAGSLDSCGYCDLVSGRVDPPLGYELYAGYDPGGMRDPAALVVVEKCVATTGNTLESRRAQRVFKVVRMETYLVPYSSSSSDAKSNDPYTKFTQRVADIHRRMHFKKLLIDSTGLGGPILEMCVQEGLPASEMKLSSSSKEEILFNLKARLEKQQVILPNDAALLSNLNCIEAERTRNGGYSFDHMSGTHDDLAYALALAVWIGGKGGTVIMMKEDRNKSFSNWREQG